MLHSTLHNQIACDVDEFWMYALDDGFNRRYYLEACGYREYRLLEQIETDATIRRRVLLCPRTSDLAAPIAKALGLGDPSVVEDGTFEKATKRYAARWTPASLAERVTMAGTIQCEARGPGRLERVADLDVDVRVFGIGWLIEREIVADIRRGYAILARFVDAQAPATSDARPSERQCPEGRVDQSAR